MNEFDKALVDGLYSYGIRTCHILGFMMGQKGGHRGLGFCKKDLYDNPMVQNSWKSLSR